MGTLSIPQSSELLPRQLVSRHWVLPAPEEEWDDPPSDPRLELLELCHGQGGRDGAELLGPPTGLLFLSPSDLVCESLTQWMGFTGLWEKPARESRPPVSAAPGASVCPSSAQQPSPVQPLRLGFSCSRSACPGGGMLAHLPSLEVPSLLPRHTSRYPCNLTLRWVQNQPRIRKKPSPFSLQDWL